MLWLDGMKESRITLMIKAVNIKKIIAENPRKLHLNDRSQIRGSSVKDTGRTIVGILLNLRSI